MEDRVNKVYLKENLLDDMRNFFQENGFIQFSDFFSFDFSKVISFMDSVDKKKVFNPLFFSYSSFDFSSINSNLDFIKLFEFFQSKFFMDFLEDLVGTQLQFNSLDYYEFEHGDYTLLNDKLIIGDCIDVIFDFSDPGFEKFMGGYLTYLTMNEEVFYVEPILNSLTIIFKPEELMSYTKYLNCLSDGRRVRRIISRFDFSEGL